MAGVLASVLTVTIIVGICFGNTGTVGSDFTLYDEIDEVAMGFERIWDASSVSNCFNVAVRSDFLASDCFLAFLALASLTLLSRFMCRDERCFFANLLLLFFLTRTMVDVSDVTEMWV